MSAPVTEELRAAALAAAASNAGSWIEMHADPESCADGPWSDPDDSAVDDDVHVEEIESALGRALTPEEHAAVWPVYRDELARLTAHLPSREAPSAPVCRCAAGCREIIDADARLCADCAELIVEVADAREDHANGCDCLGCAVWSTATVVLGGTALVWARRAVA